MRFDRTDWCEIAGVPTILSTTNHPALANEGVPTFPRNYEKIHPSRIFPKEFPQNSLLEPDFSCTFLNPLAICV
ncbi:hypothetical protein LEP1GSC052_3147 [Leptospira kmetyi serovar Malaysia str. Bejo-Iso9]|nr:hypothetical protein LEP1GSC052_3147 [Leptospira kmetyi serovar Malaysia str. Bejo-Iso9]